MMATETTHPPVVLHGGPCDGVIVRVDWYQHPSGRVSFPTIRRDDFGNTVGFWTPTYRTCDDGTAEWEEASDE